MRLPSYPRSAASGIEWLGSLPHGWQAKRLKYSASLNDDTLPETTSATQEFDYVDIGNVDPVEGIVGTERMVFDDAPSRARRLVRNGDTIISTVRTYLRAVAPICSEQQDFVVSTGFAVVRPRHVAPTFLSYALREYGFIEQVVARSTGVSYPAINASEVATIPIPLPSSDEQRAIADFLDRATARLDTLVGKKHELIEKLKEKRSALISRTVTKGLPTAAAAQARLNPHPKLKPSGIEWLGYIPEHWEVKRLSLLCAFEQGKAHEPFVDDNGQFICVNSRFVSTEGEIRKHCSENRTPAKRDDILMVMSDLPNGRALAKAYHVRDDAPYAVNQRVCRLSALAADSRYLFYQLSRSPGFLRYDDGSNQTHLSNAAFTKFPTATPPLPEQTAIAAYLDRETAKIDKMMEKVDAAIEKLQEYRTALITAAVTGKIDVRAVDR